MVLIPQLPVTGSWADCRRHRCAAEEFDERGDRLVKVGSFDLLDGPLHPGRSGTPFVRQRQPSASFSNRFTSCRIGGVVGGHRKDVPPRALSAIHVKFRITNSLHRGGLKSTAWCTRLSGPSETLPRVPRWLYVQLLEALCSKNLWVEAGRSRRARDSLQLRDSWLSHRLVTLFNFRDS